MGAKGGPVGVAMALAAAGVLSLGVGGCGGSKKVASSNVTLQIAAPRDGASVRADRVTVRGTVAPPDATVQILGQPAQVGNGVFTGSVALHPGSNTIDLVASAPGSAPVTTSITVTRLTKRPRKPKKHSNGPPPLAAPRACTSGLTAGANTSCAFAENVRAAYNVSGSGILDVYSPTTGQTYRMYCTSRAPHICTGGNGASVSFASSGVTGYTLGDCGGDLSVGPDTSCPFAENVQSEFYRSGPGWIDVYSPVTSRTYRMYCTGGSPHVCTGGNDAAVYFP